jgi:beta-glucosidase
MASYSSWNGRKMHDNPYLLTEVLKGRMGFDGLVVGDWNGHGQVPGCTNASCAAAINAGVDLVMVPNDWKAMIQHTLAQLNSGEISMSRLDEAVRRILRVKLRAGLFDGRTPSQRAAALKNNAIGNQEHRVLARRAVRESQVLLKNTRSVLPLSPRQTVLVAGEGADHIAMQAGGWSISWQGMDNTNKDFPGATSVYKGIRETVERAGGKAVLSVDGAYAGPADVAVVVFGEHPYAEWQGDVATLEFEPRNKKSLALLKKLKARGVPVVSIFLSGRPLWVNPELNASDAFVAAWLPGSEGAGVADLIFADVEGKPRYDFTGRLSFSWPKNPLQDILNPHDPGYDPLFPLGYGLSYASGAQGPGILPEDVLGVTADDMEFPFYVGALRQPWLVSIRNHEQQHLLSGAAGVLPAGDVAVRFTDRTVRGDALTFGWRDAQLAQIYLEYGDNRTVDLARYLPQGAIQFDLKVNKPLSDTLHLAVKCGSDCERRVPLTAASEGGWHTVSVPLSCLTRSGDTFGEIHRPFLLESKGMGEVVVSNIRWLRSTQDNTGCPD